MRGWLGLFSAIDAACYKFRTVPVLSEEKEDKKRQLFSLLTSCIVIDTFQFIYQFCIVLVFRCYYNKLLPIQWLKTIRIFLFTLWGQRLTCHLAKMNESAWPTFFLCTLGENFLPLPTFKSHPHSLAHDSLLSPKPRMLHLSETIYPTDGGNSPHLWNCVTMLGPTLTVHSNVFCHKVLNLSLFKIYSCHARQIIHHFQEAEHEYF